MKKLFWILLLGIAAATTSWGQLGETPDQCDQRYGLNHTQKGADGFLAFSREYTHNDLLVTVRFITLSTGANVAGWITYGPSSKTQNSSAAREKIREAASTNWAPVEVTEISKEMEPQIIELTKVHNKHIAETRATITKVTRWTSMRCWLSPTAYAADNGINLIIFSDAYLKQFDR